MGLLALACSPAERSHESPRVEQTQASADAAPTIIEVPDYHGHRLHFPREKVDAVTDYRGVYVRLKPDGDGDHFNYTVELGRPDTGKPSYGMRMKIGFYSFGATSRTIDLGDHYTMWCEPVPGEPGGGTCAVLLRSLPLAALTFPIGKIPTAQTVRAAIALSEAFLRRATLS